MGSAEKREKRGLFGGLECVPSVERAPEGKKKRGPDTIQKIFHMTVTKGSGPRQNNFVRRKEKTGVYSEFKGRKKGTPFFLRGEGDSSRRKGGTKSVKIGG